MKTKVNNKLYTLNELLENYTYSSIFELIHSYISMNDTLEYQKRLLMFDFEDNDVEAMQLIDTIELQQYYFAKNFIIFNQALLIKEKAFFMDIQNTGVLIGLN